MNFKTTLFLALLVLGGGLGWYFLKDNQPQETASPTAAFLEKQLQADALTRIEVKRGSQGYVLERGSAKEEWTLPGNWPARAKEAEQLVNTLANMHTRFAAFPLEEKKSLLTKDPLVLKVRLGEKTHVLT